MGPNMEGITVTATPIPAPNVTVDGYVLPSWLGRALHVAAALLGAFVDVAPTVHPGWHLSTLGQLAAYLGGSTLTLGSVISLASNEKAHALANAATARVSIAAITPEVENVVTSKVVPFIDTEFPGFKQALTERERALVEQINTWNADMHKAIPDMPSIVAAIKPQLDAWLASQKLQVVAQEGTK